MNVLVQNIPFGEYYFPLKNEFWKKDLILFSLKKKGSILSMLLFVSSAACEHLGISLLGCLSCYNMLMQLIYLR